MARAINKMNIHNLATLSMRGFNEIVIAMIPKER